MSYLETAKRIAREAGAMIKSRMNTTYILDEKSSSFDLVTEIDRSSEELIRQRILEAYPNHAFLGEEESYGDATQLNDRLQKAAAEPFLWIVDPIDGTTNFVHGIPGYTVSIALACEGVLKVGVVYDPLLDELFWAEQGSGAFLNNQNIRVSNEQQLDQIVIGTGFPTNALARSLGVQCLIGLSAACRSVRSLGSAALQLAYVASGRLGAYFEYGLNVWDTAAGVVLIQEAGGQVGDTKGDPFSLNVRHIVASNGQVHSAVLEHMKEYE